MKSDKTYIIFIYLALIFGTLFIFLTPPFQSPDEDSHLKKAYTIGRLRLFHVVDNDIEGYYIPDKMIEYIEEKKSSIGNYKWKYTYKDFYKDNFLVVDYSKKSLVDFSTKNALIIPYIPASIGIFIARSTSNLFVGGECSTAYMLYFARFLNLLSYIIIIALAIKTTPILKKTITTIMLLPMSLFLGSMVTYDCMLISLCILTLSLILKLIYDKEQKFEIKHLIYFCIVGFILLRVKIVYSLILILLMLVSKDKFKDKNKLKYAIYCILGIIGLYFVSKIPSLFIKSVSGNDFVTSEQISFIKNNPISFVYIILKNIYTQKITLLVQLIGVLGLIDTYMPTIIIMFLFTLLLMVSLSELSLSKIKIDVKTKFISFTIFILILISIFIAMYVSWTPQVLGVGANIVSGVQGRYFLPVLILPLFIFSNGKLKKYKSVKKIMEFILEHYFIVSIIGLICATLMLLFRYWC